MYCGSTYIKFYLDDDGTYEVETYRDNKLVSTMVRAWRQDVGK